MAQACNLARLSWRARDRDEPEIIVQRAPVSKMMGPLTVELPPGAFMQPGAEGEAALVGAVLTPLRQAGVKRTADLFAGCARSPARCWRSAPCTRRKATRRRLRP